MLYVLNVIIAVCILCFTAENKESKALELVDKDKEKLLPSSERQRNVDGSENSDSDSNGSIVLYETTV